MHRVFQRYQWSCTFFWLRSRRFSWLTAAATARLPVAQPFCCFLLLPSGFLPAAVAFLPRGEADAEGFQQRTSLQRGRHPSTDRPLAGISLLQGSGRRV